MAGCRSLGGSTAGAAFKLPEVKRFSTTTSYTTPTDVDYIEVFVVGGGGGGGGSDPLYGGGTGGGAGGVESGFFPSGTYAITVGANAAGGAAGADGANGSNTTFDTLTALGGSGGLCPTAAGAFRGGASAAMNSDGFYGRGSGSHSNIDQGGGGGSNFLGSGARAEYCGTGARTGNNGSFAGGAGGINNGGGGIGSSGTVLIIEHFL